MLGCSWVRLPWRNRRVSRKTRKSRSSRRTGIPPRAERDWEAKTLAPSLKKLPERPIGAATGVNLEADGSARFTTVSGYPVQRLYTEADLPEEWAARQAEYLGAPGRASLHARNSRQRLPGQVVVDAPVLRLRFSRRNQSPLQIPAGQWRQRAFGGIRSADA